MGGLSKNSSPNPLSTLAGGLGLVCGTVMVKKVGGSYGWYSLFLAAPRRLGRGVSANPFPEVKWRPALQKKKKKKKKEGGGGRGRSAENGM